MSWREVWFLVFSLTTVSVESQVLVDRRSAGQVLRSRRANSFLLEELRPGSLERECYEEHCSKEEAGEIFQSHEKTMEFWYRYTDRDPCVTNRCLNGGICMVDGGHPLCLCPPQLQGDSCQTEVSECRYRNGGCLQYCTDRIQDGTPAVQCGCAAGYQLDPDGQRCSKTVPFPCGLKMNQPYHLDRSLLPNPSGNLTSETSVTAESNVTTETIVTTEINATSENEVTIETNRTMEQDWSTEMDLTAKANTTMETEVTKETNVTMETEVTKETNVTTETEGAPHSLDSEKQGASWGKEDLDVAVDLDLDLDKDLDLDQDLDHRIIGGFLERQGQSPWQVLVHRKDGYGFCGGTLVSDRWVVSAAHCFEQNPDHVTVGDYDKKRLDPGEQLIKVEEVFLHPHFHSYTFDSDVALLYLAQRVVLGPTALPVCLPNPQLASYLHKDGAWAEVTGWGAMQYLGRSSRFLRKVVVPLVSRQNCVNSTEQVITDNMFCAGYLEAAQDACSGDSGGPLVVQYRDTTFLLGVVSWGEQCAARGKYGVYTRLANFLSWIHRTIDRHEQNRAAQVTV